MKKTFLFSVLAYLLSVNLFAQSIGINDDGTLADSSAMLDVKSVNKGLLIPRIALTGTDDASTVISARVSLMIYNTSTAGTGTTAVTPGFYFWSGSQWLRFSVAGNNALSPWMLGGNAGTDPLQHFIGTTDLKPLIFKTWDQFSGMIDPDNQNTSFGLQSFNTSSTGNRNVAMGAYTLYNNTTGYYNIAIGTEALASNTTGNNNISIGINTMVANSSGVQNTGIGTDAMAAITTGNKNNAVGNNALFNIRTGSFNSAFGHEALLANTTGSRNTAIGAQSNVGSNNLENATTIGANARVDCSNCLVLGSINGINGAGSNVNVGIGTTNPNSTSILDLTSTDRGLLIPRMTQSQRDAISSPSTSLMIYQTDGTAGFYYYNGSSWTAVGGNTNILWSLNGNTGTDPNINFIGTSDNKPLIFKINNQLAGTIEGTNNNTFIGARTGITNTGNQNTVFGSDALFSNTTGTKNIAVGAFSLYHNTDGSDNTANGVNALFFNTTGNFNTAYGNNTLSANTTGSFNTAAGLGSLSANTTGQNNTATGFSALSHNTTGGLNTADGTGALQSNTSGIQNTANGFGALVSNTTGKFNTANGVNSLFSNTIGDLNTALGHSAGVSTGNLFNTTAIGANAQAGQSNSVVIGSVNGINGATSDVNVGIGTTTPNVSAALDIRSTDKGLLIPRLAQTQRDAISSPSEGLMIYQTDGSAGFYYYDGTQWTTLAGSSGPTFGPDQNTPFGQNALISNTTGQTNSAFGAETLRFNTTGSGNTATGRRSLYSNTTGIDNTGNGSASLSQNTTGRDNVADGLFALTSNTTGDRNTGLGSRTLLTNSTGSYNTAVGSEADVLVDGLSNATAVGAKAAVNCSDCMVLGSVSGVNSAGNNVRVGVGTITPNSSSVLDLTSTSRGLLIPRMTQSQRDAISSPSTSLMIYQTDGTTGFYYYNGTAWTSVGGNTNNVWSINGNTATNPGTNFIGTTDNQPLVFKINNQVAGRLGILSNTAFGLGSLLSTTGNFNTAYGANSLRMNTSGNENTAVGINSLFQNTTGGQNTSIGSSALLNNTTGNANTATGSGSLLANTSGFGNTSNGVNSLFSNSTGGENTGMGAGTLSTNSTGSQNTALGSGANVSADGLNNATAIGCNTIVNASNKVRIGNSGVTVIEGQVPFTTPSDGRFKYNVQEDVKGLDFILKLRPITYQFDTKKLDDEMQPGGLKNVSYAMQASYNEASSVRRTGFIAQEVEKAATETGYDFSGIIKPHSLKDHYGLSYESFVVPLVKAVQEQQKQIENLQKENDELKKLKEQVDLLSKKIESLSANK